jgi:hypothetical protein
MVLLFFSPFSKSLLPPFYNIEDKSMDKIRRIPN